MRRLAFLAVFASTIAAAQVCTSPTSNLQLCQPNYGTPNWNLQLNPNFQKIDTAIGLLQLPYVGAWSSTANYQRGQQVSYGGTIYTSIVNANFNNTPSLTSLVWQQVPYGSGGGGSLPSGPAYAVQAANSLVTGPTSDPNITINTTQHSLNVGGALPANVFTLGPHTAPLPASWTLDTYSAATALASLGGVPNNLTINGHALTGNFSLSYADFGNLPVADLNGGTGASNTTFWRGDGVWASPGGGVSAINSTTGAFTFTGSGVSQSGNTFTFSGGSAGVSAINTQTGGLTFTGDGIKNSGTTFTVKWQRGLDAVATLGIKSDNSADVSAALQAYFNTYTSSQVAPDLYFPCGQYYFHAGVVLASTQANPHLIGDGKAGNISAGTISSGQMSNSCVTFDSDQPLVFLWADTTTTSSNLNSLGVEHIQFADTSASHNQVLAAVRVTNQSNFLFRDISGLNLYGQDVTGLTVTVNSASTSWSVTAGTINCTSILNGGGFIWVNGLPHEITNCTGSSAPYTITSALQYEGANYTGSADISYGGHELWFDPGAAASGFAQFGDVYDLHGHCVANAVFASSGANGGLGTSRIKFMGGYVNGCSATIADTIWGYFGHYSDTFRTETKANSYAFGVFIADGHQHDITGFDWENSSGSTPIVPSCGASPSYACGYGIYVMSDNASDTYGNRISDNYLRQAGSSQGVGITLNGVLGQYPTQTKVGLNTFRSLSTNCSLSNSTHTTGECDGVGYFDSLYVNGSLYVPPVAPITITVSAFSAAPNTCYNLTGSSSWTQSTGSPAPTTTTMTGLSSTMAPHWTPTAELSQIVGWGAINGMELIVRASAANTLSSVVCNVTPSTIAQGGFTANVSAP